MGKLTERPTGIIRIDRSEPFDPTGLCGVGWGIKEEDKHSLSLTEIDPREISLETVLYEGEDVIDEVERFRRLRELGLISLDALVLQTLLKDPTLIPEDWKKRDKVSHKSAIRILFHGTRLKGPLNATYVPGLSWDDGRWFYFRVPLYPFEFTSHLSAVLKNDSRMV